MQELVLVSVKGNCNAVFACNYQRGAHTSGYNQFNLPVGDLMLKRSVNERTVWELVWEVKIRSLLIIVGT